MESAKSVPATKAMRGHKAGPTISAVVICRNEENVIARCLESLTWADEIIVVDSDSTDQTLPVAKKFTSRIFTHPWQGFGPQKQFAVEQAHSDWILVVDADEVVTKELAAEIRLVCTGDTLYQGYRIKRKSNFLGRWVLHGGWYPDFVLRLFRTGKGRFTRARVHESLWVDGSVGTLDGELLHYTDPVLTHYLAKLDRYTGLSAQELFEQHYPFRIWDLLVRPPAVFFKMYVWRAGFLDGIEGFLLALCSAIHVLMKYAKLWEYYHNPNARDLRSGNASP